jgi:hypothetical protein
VFAALYIGDIAVYVRLKYEDLYGEYAAAIQAYQQAQAIEPNRSRNILALQSL